MRGKPVVYHAFGVVNLPERRPGPFPERLGPASPSIIANLVAAKGRLRKQVIIMLFILATDFWLLTT